MSTENTTMNNDCKTCPVSTGTHKPAEAVHQIDEPQAEALRYADMFWDDDGSEQQYGSIEEFLNVEICNGYLEVGQIRTMQRGIRLPNIYIRVTAIDEEESEATYEIIDAAIAAQAKQGAQA